MRKPSIDAGAKIAPFQDMYTQSAESRPQSPDSDAEEEARNLKADISTTHRRFVSGFDTYVKGKSPTSEEEDLALSYIKVTNLDLTDMAHEGTDCQTVLHIILDRPSQFKKRMPLLRLVMQEYPRLYESGVKEKKSILHKAADKCDTSKTDSQHNEYLGQLIQLYPSQFSWLLKESSDQEKLLSRIMPFIQCCGSAEFLEFFGEEREEARKHACCCQFCEKSNTCDIRVNNGSVGSRAPSELDGHATVMGSMWAKHHVSENKINNIVTLHFPPQSPAALPTLTPAAAKPRDIEAKIYEDGNTSLHLAAQYRQEDPERMASQLEMVKRVYAWQPAALELTNTLGQSPYLNRVSAYGSDLDKMRHDSIAFFLKDKIMHIQNRDMILDLLYGKSQVNQGPDYEKPTDRSQLHQFDEREIHLDLCEIQMSGLSTDKESLLDFLESLDFENILQYVQIPRRPFRSGTSRNQTGDISDTIPPETGAGRSDFKQIFDLLQEKGVKKIVQLIVDDDEEYPHRDDIIEAVADFDVEVFEWRKMDLSSTVLKVAAAQARQLHLFCSGNDAALRDWSSCDGLNQLEQLSSVQLTIYWRIESRNRTKKHAYDFIHKITQICPQVRDIEVRIEALTSRSRDKWYDHGTGLTTNLWLAILQKFTGTLANLQQFLKPREQVRVAILDDGIDWSYANSTPIKCHGRSFFVEKRRNFNRQNPWYFSSRGHGTLMARLVRELCPSAELYIARLDQTISESGQFQPTADSAAKAIHWAVDKKVHIISMSWTIPVVGSNNLEKAARRAKRENIIMFGSASDKGVHNAEKPFMTRLSPELVICIGGAREAGYGDDATRPEADFFFPGETKGVSQFPEITTANTTSHTAEFGSSVATALASGFTALLMLLVEMCTLRTNETGISVENLRQELQIQENIRYIFTNMTIDMRNVLKNLRHDNVILVSKYFKPDWGDSMMEWKDDEKQRKLNELVLDILPRDLITTMKSRQKQGA